MFLQRPKPSINFLEKFQLQIKSRYFLERQLHCFVISFEHFLRRILTRSDGSLILIINVIITYNTIPLYLIKVISKFMKVTSAWQPILLTTYESTLECGILKIF